MEQELRRGKPVVVGPMRIGISSILAIYLLSALALAVVPALAAGKKSLRPSQVVTKYEEVEKPEHREIEAILKDGEVLERIAEILSPLKLPRRLTLRALPCTGDAETYYEDGDIQLCYDYLHAVLRRASDGDAPAGTSQRNLIIGAVVDAALHEAGHAAFDMLEIPVFGREEDAADQFSAFVMLQFAEHEARQLVLGAMFWFVRSQVNSSPPRLKDFADEHGLPAQRYFNYICLAYGADPTALASAADGAKLSKSRAKSCEAEYRQVERAFRKLILPYVDRRTLAKVRARRQWFDLDPVE